MSYTINTYNATLLTTIPDGEKNTTSTSLTLAGRNFPGYGQFLNENQVYLLENFAGTTSPVNPIKGQLWYNTATGVINVYNGTQFGGLASTAMLAANVSTIEAKIAANVSTLNSSIISNVAALTSNAASQQTHINNLWANAAIQDTSIQSLWANAASQTSEIGNLWSNTASLSQAIDLRANIASPTLTGNPRSVTTSAGDRSTTIATTAFVMTQDDTRRIYVDTQIEANIASLTSYADDALALKADLESAELTGIPLAPTASVSTRTAQIATTAYVMAQDDVRRIYADTNIAANIATLTTTVNNGLNAKADIASPTLTGTPRSVTPTTGDNSTRIATTAFVQGEVAANALWEGSHRYISTGTPSSGTGVDGDFWFQYQ
jgi:hypothetical protein